MLAHLSELIAAAKGERPCDLLLRGGYVLNVFLRQFQRCDLAVHRGMVVGLGERPAREIVDVEGLYLVPGFMDGHVHLESSMLTPEYYAQAVVPRGTTGVVADPHEFANVCGLEGVRYLQRARSRVPLELFIGVPSCVPATPLEDAGAALEAEDIASLRGGEGIVGLGEMMNYPGLLAGEESVLAKLGALGNEAHIDGHAPSLSGPELQAYVLAGISTDHECTTLAEAREKLALGMRIMLRQGSLARNLETLAPLVTESVLERCLLVTDDREPEDLLREGHLDYLIELAIKSGIRAEAAFMLASWNVAQAFQLPRLGALTPGYWANICALSKKGQEWSEGFKVLKVWQRGRLVAAQGQYLYPLEEAPRGALEGNSIHLAPDWRGHLTLSVPTAGEYRARVIGLEEGSLLTEAREATLKAQADGQGGWQVAADPERDILKLAAYERHKASGKVGLGFLQGLKFKGGALASTVAHDSHNLVVVGDNDRDMELAVETLAHCGGGLTFVQAGQVKSTLPLPIAGLVSPQPLEKVYEALSNLYAQVRQAGCPFDHPFMALAFMTLPVIPHLKLSDRGLVDVDRFQIVGSPILGPA